jgi:enediyne biosynthesis protein E4
VEPAPAVARGMAAGDLDNDGALDLVITSVSGPARVLRNVTNGTAGRHGAAAHWLTLRVIDPSAGGRDAYGAEVAVRAGGKVRAAWVNPGSSYLCSNDPRVHVGLGGDSTVEWVRVKWPDGTEEEFPGGPADRAVVLARGAGSPRPGGAASRPAGTPPE